MFTFLKIAPLLICGCLYSQEKILKSVYFEFDKYQLDDQQTDSILDLVRSVDTTRIESIAISGYCDDIGNDSYNYILSNNRANTIKNQLMENGIKHKILVNIKGKGRILIEKDTVDNLSRTRAENRRVDILFVLQSPQKKKPELPGMIYNTVNKKHIVGDRIVLENILFERGRSVLTVKAKNELDRIAKLLQQHKNIHFEIQGHVCCTPVYQKEAINKDTKKRSLSKDRAETVYKYLIFRKIAKTRMTFKGYGTSQPLNKGSQYDRRVELLITKV